jgi:hypothetical protein
MSGDTREDPASLNWTQTIEHARHWEMLLFENAKSYFTIIAAALGAAGAVMAWSAVPRYSQLAVICFFLASAGVIAVCAISTINSTQRYLKRLYCRRAQLEKGGGLILMTSADVGRKATTVSSLRSAFRVAIILAVGLLALALATPETERLDLSGADLTLARNLVQRNLESACGDATTKLPPGLVLSPCAP